MKNSLRALALCTALGAHGAAQNPSIQDQLTALQQMMREIQTQHQQEIDALKKQLADQQALIDGLQKSAATSTTPPLPAGKAGEAPPGATLFPTTDESVVATTPPPAAPGAAPLTAPIALLGGGKNYLNISLDGLFVGAMSTERDFDLIAPGGHDPVQRGFTIQNVELTLDGAVDPYFTAQASIILLQDRDGGTEVELEEAWMQTSSLPWGLQVKGGQFLSAFGRQNQLHPHSWDFADTTLANARLLGPDGMRGPGLQIAWLAPLPWFSELSVAAQNGRGETGYLFRNRGDDDVFYSRATIDRELRGPQDLAFVGRWTNSFDLSATQTLLAGVSGAFGPNDTGNDTRTRIYGADVFYKWKSPRAEGGFPVVKWQTEALLSRFEAGEGADGAAPRETLTDWGAYSQVLWGFRKGWIAGVRADWLDMDESSFTGDPTRQDRWRVSANLTWFPTEFSKLRLQYNHDFMHSNAFQDEREADSVFLQFEFILGAHAAHKF